MHVTADFIFGTTPDNCLSIPAIKTMVLMQLLGAFSANEAKFRKRSQRQKINNFNVAR
jgi:hypothetical protein